MTLFGWKSRQDRRAELDEELRSHMAMDVSTREMGVRIALGARAADVHRLVLWDGLRTVLIGGVLGIVLALALGRLIASLLYGVSARDPITMLVSVLVLLGAGALAGLLPAWRASRVDPVVALRAD